MGLSKNKQFIPKFFDLFKSNYSFLSLKKDLFAGLTVGLVSIPLVMAFAISSGNEPGKGLFTAIVAGFLISLFGGSRFQIGGPTGAFVILIYDVMQRTGYPGLAVSTLIASILLVITGICRLGTWIQLVPYPLVTGFTAGIAFILFSSQMKDFLGLSIDQVQASCVDKWKACWDSLHTLNGTTLFVSCVCLTILILVKKYWPRVPGSILAIFIASAFVYFFHLPIDTIYTKFGDIPTHLPFPSWPSFAILKGREIEIFKDAFAIAFLCSIESLLSAVIADGMTGKRHRSNCELIAQGIGNFGSVLFGGIPATGAIARTALNVKSGAETPVAGMFHAVVILLSILWFNFFVSSIPLAALSAVLIMVAWNMSEMKHFIYLLKSPKEDVCVLLTGFFLTVFVDITVAILVGMILSSLLFMKKMSQFSKSISLLKKTEITDLVDEYDHKILGENTIPSGIEVYEIQGPFFFGAANILKDVLEQMSVPPQIFILKMKQVPMIDASGMYALKEFYKRCHQEKITLFLTGVNKQSLAVLRKGGLMNMMQETHIFPHLEAALKAAQIQNDPKQLKDLELAHVSLRE